MRVSLRRQLTSPSPNLSGYGAGLLPVEVENEFLYKDKPRFKLTGMDNSRSYAFIALRAVHRGAYADAALDKVLRRAELSSRERAAGATSGETLSLLNAVAGATSGETLSLADRRLVTDLVYGSVRRQRTLDALIDQLAKKKAHQQPLDLRTIIHLGLYQLRYQERIPSSAAVNTTVHLAKENGLAGLAGFVNGLLRQYIRLASDQVDPLSLPENPVEFLGVLHSYPNWVVEVWLEQLGMVETEQLCEWMNQSPTIDLRINPLQVEIEKVEAALLASGVLVRHIPQMPQALKLIGSTGSIQNLPGFSEGWWTVQDSSAQLVSHLLNPQPGEVIVDACAAPGGKTTHIAELMGDRGTVWACDRAAARLRKLEENVKRLQLQSIQLCIGDSRNLTQFENSADRVLLDVPCSGLGTLHRHADARWRQTTESVRELSILQKELLLQASTFVKPGGVLVYATCTLHPLENEGVIQAFLARHPNWQIDPPTPDTAASAFATLEGWVKVWPHRHQMDGFFMVRLKKARSSAE
ncbi:MAG: 16S rRNA (cytosine(967)-C(5))-methyltransferase [Chroococcidiopsidaceae cyanobacterium CP_BM_RX_35]|nr:16S rRNA (cytosine(967)-C(5))-methyltransferase [Chroococcidiopsidaceae cyanobacterium CP_BM_RX_35]